MRRTAVDFTPLELEVMQVLWELGPTTVQAVQQQMQSKRPLAYNTVQTVLTILHRKGKVKRVTQQRAYVYSAAVSREKTAAHALKSLVDRMFGGKPDALVLSMVKHRQLSPELLAELRNLVDKGGDHDSD